MAEFLFPCPGSALRNLLDSRAESGEPFTEDEATLDTMLALDRGDFKPQRYYQKRWKWSKGTTSRLLKHGDPNNLQSRAHVWRTAWRRAGVEKHVESPLEGSKKLGQAGARLGQAGAKNGHDDPENATPGADLGQVGARLGQYRSELQNYRGTSKEVPNIGPKSDRKTRPACKKWHVSYARTALTRMRDLGLLSTHVKRALRRDEDKVLDDWSHVIRLLDEQDGWKKEQIRTAFDWLFHAPNDWVEKRQLQSLSSLRGLTRSGDRTRFEAIYNQAISDGRPTKKQGFDDPKASYERIRRVADAALDPE